LDDFLVLTSSLHPNGPANSRQTPHHKRLDWQKPHHKKRMTEALNEWMKMPDTSSAGKESRGNMTRGSFAKQKAVPVSTFRARLKQQDPLTVPVTGRPSLISPDDRKAVVDAVCRLDDHNRGADTNVIITSINDTFPHLSREQVGNSWHNTIKTNPLLTGRLRSEASEVKRTMAVNEIAQRSWFIFVKRHRKKLQELSPGLYKGQPYQFHIKNFTVGDEGGIQVSAQAHLVGRAGKQTHLNHSKSNRCSGTRLAMGSAAAVKGPSWYILAQPKSGWRKMVRLLGVNVATTPLRT
jgi:hypothetical protein